MSQDSSHQEVQGTPVASSATVDAATALLIGILGAVVMVQARQLGAEWTSDGPGAGYFPFYIGLVLVVCSAVVFFQSLRARASSETFVDSVQLKRVLSVLLPSAVYIGAIWVLGLYVASALFIALFMIILGKYAVARSVGIGVAVNALFFLMFEVWFKVPLFKGVLEPLRFLGY
jgi:hypothetical protein